MSTSHYRTTRARVQELSQDDGFDRSYQIDKLSPRILQNDCLADKFDAIRELYRLTDTSEYNPYLIDWHSTFTPIEYALWCDMRSSNLDMWPQFPVGRYFLDFADPKHRIAIEADGRRWHNRQKDAVRDQWLLDNYGWRVFHVSGSECIDPFYPDWDSLHEGGFDEARKIALAWLLSTGSGLVSSVRHVFYGQDISRYLTLDDALLALNIRTLAGNDIDAGVQS